MQPDNHRHRCGRVPAKSRLCFVTSLPNSPKARKSRASTGTRAARSSQQARPTHAPEYGPTKVCRVFCWVGRLIRHAGDLRSKLLAHGGPIFSLRWNKEGTLLVTASVDQSAIVWQADTGDARQIFRFHTGLILAVLYCALKYVCSALPRCVLEKRLDLCQLLH
jgi:WD40 repeat protein